MNGTAQAPAWYGATAIHGTWVSPAFDTCVTWRDDGSAVARYRGGRTETSRWGVLVTSAGAPYPNAATWAVATPSIDPQIAGLYYNVATQTFVNQDFRRGSCPY